MKLKIEKLNKDLKIYSNKVRKYSLLIEINKIDYSLSNSRLIKYLIHKDIEDYKKILINLNARLILLMKLKSKFNRFLNGLDMSDYKNNFKLKTLLMNLDIVEKQENLEQKYKELYSSIDKIYIKAGVR